MPKGNPSGYYGGGGGYAFGGPRQKLLRVMRASGVSDSAGAALANEAFGAEVQKKKKKRAGVRQAIMAKLREIGAKAKKVATGY